MHWEMQNEQKWKSHVYEQAFIQAKFLLLFFLWDSLKDTRVHSGQWEGCCVPM